MPVTQLQIAQKLGVDQRTVSIALGATGRISDGMRQKVLNTAQKMGYRPNRLAAGLRGSKTQTIGIIWLFADAWMGDATVALDVLNHAQNQDLQVIQAQLPDDAQHICKQIDDMLERRVDAIILQGSKRQLTTPSVTRRLRKSPAVIGVCPEPIDNFPGDLVIHDRFDAIRQIVNQLADTGRQRPLFMISMDQENNPPKYDVFADQCRKRGIDHPNMLLSIDNLVEPDMLGPRHSDKFNERYPEGVQDIDAIVTFNDIGALYIMRELDRRGINVPQDIAVVGFNNMEAGRIWKPALSSGDRNRDTLAYIIKQMLDSRLKDQTIKPRTQTIHMAFLPRASSE